MANFLFKNDGTRPRVYYLNGDTYDCRRENLSLSIKGVSARTAKKACWKEPVWRTKEARFRVKAQIDGQERYVHFSKKKYGTKKKARAAAIEYINSLIML
jgi:hypothetical protein